MLKDLVVEDKEGVVRGSEREKNICNSISYGTEEVTATTINMGSQTDMISSRDRSSHRRSSVRKGVFRNFAKFTRKDLCQSLFFNKVAGLRPAALLK